MLESELWDGRRGIQEQRGAGAYTLCERCNSDTGAWYGAEYVAWAQQGMGFLSRIPATEEEAFFIPFRGKPLRFLKQVVTMFFSVNAEDFAGRHPYLVKFVLDRATRGLPPRYLVDLVLVRGNRGRSCGVYARAHFESGTVQVASEVAHVPFAFRLILAEAKQATSRHGAIESFASMGLDERREVWLYTMAGHLTTKLPGDYRSPERVQQEVDATNEALGRKVSS